MDTACLNYCLTEQEQRDFEEQGYFIIENAISPQMIEKLTAVVDRIDSQERIKQGLGPNDRMFMADFIGKDDIFLSLLDWPQTIAKVWGILGWNIQLYHTHLIVTPPVPPAEQQNKKVRFSWHQDSGRLNWEMETNPRPRISLKVAFFLTDTREVGSGNFYVIPGSHVWNSIDFPDDPTANPAGATPVRAAPGSAVFFDRRIWHAGTPNYAGHARKVLFYGYSYRWIRPRDNMTVDRYMESCDPIQRQLLGASPTGGLGYSSPTEEDVPLKSWIAEHAGAAAMMP